MTESTPVSGLERRPLSQSALVPAQLTAPAEVAVHAPWPAVNACRHGQLDHICCSCHRLGSSTNTIMQSHRAAPHLLGSLCILHSPAGGGTLIPGSGHLCPQGPQLILRLLQFKLQSEATALPPRRLNSATVLLVWTHMLDWGGHCSQLENLIWLIRVAL